MKTKINKPYMYSSLRGMAIYFLLLFTFTSGMKASTITTNLANNNGSNAIVFNFQNTNAYDIVITGIGSVSGITGMQTAELWAKIPSSDPAGLPGIIDNANGWTLVKTANVATTANTVTSTAELLLSGFNFVVPENSSVRFCLKLSSSLRYSTLGAQACIFSHDGCILTSCTNYGYGGSFPSPVDNSMGFIGFINFAIGYNCLGNPIPGNTVSSATSVCPGKNFTLSLQNVLIGFGLTYQWQSADDDLFTINVMNLGTSSTQTTAQQSTKYYRCVVNCVSGASTIGISTPVKVDLNTLKSCYCSPVTNCTLPDMITNVSFAGINRTSLCDNPVKGYSYYPVNPYIGSVTAGSFYPMSISTAGDTEGIAVWIDYNQDGVFDATELVLHGYTGSLSAIYTGTVTIPTNALSCLTVMRVRCAYAVDPSVTIGPCNNTARGETEDYLIQVDIPPVVQNINATCEYHWECNGVTYQTSGIYNCYSPDSKGCVHSHILNLNLAPCPCPCDTTTMTPTLIINTAYNEIAGTAIPANAIAPGNHDGLWKLVSGPAIYATQYNGPPLPAKPFVTDYCNGLTPHFTNSNWISPYISSCCWQNNDSVPYTFQYEFCLCDDDSVTFDFDAMKDDTMHVYLDNHAYTFHTVAPIPGLYHAYDYGATKLFLKKGRHTINVDLFNLGYYCLGFDLAGSISGNHLIKHGYCDSTFVTADAGKDTTICIGECVILSAPFQPGVSYHWKNLQTNTTEGISNSISVCPTVTTCYELMATNIKGCVAKDTVCVTVTSGNVTIVNVTACGSYYWPCTTLLYTSSGTYDCIIAPCDTLRLVLIILSGGGVIDIFVDTCNSYTWACNGTTYYNSGNYTCIVIGTGGCIYTYVLHLNLIPCPCPCEPANMTSSLVINTAYDEVSGNSILADTTQPGAHDVLWTLISAPLVYSAINAGQPLPAQPYVTDFCANPAIFHFPNSNWISPYITSCCWQNNDTPYVFRYEFCLCDDDSVTFDFKGMKDDSMIVYIDDHTYIFQAGNSIPGLYHAKNYGITTLFLKKGKHSMNVDLFNLGTSCLGFNLAGTISGDHLLKHGSCDSNFVAADAGNDTTICTGECVTLSAPFQTGVSYQWHRLQPYTLAGNSNSITVCPTFTTCYELAITNANGCVSKDTICITVNQVGLTIVSDTACDAFTWICNGATYIASGVYDCVNSPCDTTRLILTIIPSYSTMTTASACDTFRWPVNNFLYNMSGVYTLQDTLDSCHTYILNLTIYYSNSGSSYEEFCGCSYFWNNQILTNSGTYTDMFTNAEGCDSVHTLHLTISNSSIACIDTNSLIINTGYDPVNNAAYTSNGWADPLWQMTNPNNTNFHVVYTDYLSPWITNPESHFIGYNNCLAGMLTFRRTFKTCSSDSLTFDFYISYDNWINNMLIDGVVIPGMATNPLEGNLAFTSFHHVSFTIYLNKGVHHFDIQVMNNDWGSGINLYGTIAATTSSLVANTSPINCCCGQLFTPPTSCTNTDTLTVSTGYIPASGGMISDGQYDTKWKVTVPSGATDSAKGTSLPGNWGSNPNCHAIQGQSDTGTFTYNRIFKTCIDDTLTFSFNLLYDNWLNGIYIDGVLITNPSTITPVGNRGDFSNFTTFHDITFTSFLTSGTHTLAIKIHNNEGPTCLNLYGGIKGKTNSLVTNTSPDSCHCACNASFSIASSYCKNKTIYLSSNSNGNLFLNKWEVTEADTNCNSFSNVLETKTGDTTSIHLNTATFVQGHCYRIKHIVYTTDGTCCDYSQCFCIPKNVSIDTICTPYSYTWNGVSYIASGIYSHTYMTPDSCVFTEILNLTISNVAALSLDGIDDHVSISDNASIDFGMTNFTIEVWAKFDPIQPNWWPTILGKRTSAMDGLRIYTYMGKLNLLIGGVNYGPFGSNLHDDICHHIALTRNGTSFKVYIDNVLEGSITSTHNPNSTGTLYFGWDNISANFTHMKGVIDEVRIWNYTLNQAQLQANGFCDIAPQFGLGAYYRFNEGIPNANNTSVPSVIDHSGFNHPGEFQNMSLTGSVSNYVNGCVPCCQFNISPEVEEVTSCGNYIWSVTGLNYTTSGVYTSGANTLQLNLLQNSSSTSTISFTNSFTWAATGLTYTASGLYTTTLQNEFGCDSNLSLNLTILPGNFLLDILSDQAISCHGSYNGSVQATATPIGNYTYAISHPSQAGSSNSTGYFNQLEPGVHTLCVTQNNAPFATVCAQISIDEPDPLSAIIILDTIITCTGNNGAISAMITGGTNSSQPYITYWTDGSNNLLNPYPNNFDLSLTGLSAGSYHLLVEDNHGCFANADIALTSPDPIVLTASTISADCTTGLGSIAVTSTGGVGGISYSVNGMPLATAYSPGNYIVVATDMNGCTSSVAVMVSQASPLIVSASTTNPGCFNGSNGSVNIVAVGGTPPYTGTGIFSSLSVGTYAYTVTDASGCYANVAVNIIEPSALEILATTIDVSCGNSSDGAASISAVGGTPPYSGTGTFSGLAAGIYTYHVIDANGCEATSIVTISGTPLPPISVNGNQSSICSGSSMLLTASSVHDPNYDYYWSPATGLNNIMGASVTANPLVSTQYTVTGIDMNGCSNTASILVIVDTCITSSVLSLHCFIQGYWDGMSGMAPVLANQMQASASGACDTIDVELHDAISPYAMVASTRAILNQDGTSTCNFPSLNGNYFIVVKHRNALQTWSANPVPFNSSLITYNFSTAASQAYGSNQIEVAPGIWAFYSGDVEVDENIDLLDFTSLETDINNFQFGYYATDLNGDGNVDLLDAPSIENNINNFIYSNHP